MCPFIIYPDTLTNGNTFVFIHGFNVSGEAARGWHAEIFKRMHQMGSKARFVGISWHGDVSPDYHEAVKHAFMLSERLNAWLQVPGEITIAAHSLGNMVVSNAIEYEGFSPKRYYMINAATPIEAYDASQTSNADNNDMSLRMVENSWKPYDRRLYASNWHELFAQTAADGRNKLKWKDRFAGKVPGLAYNFYSTEENVVENADAGESFGGNILWHRFTRHAWVQNEIAKGNSSLAAELTLKDTHAGWRFHFRFSSRVQRGAGYEVPGFLGGKSRMYKPDETEEITNNQLKEKPFYWPFEYGELYDAAKGSAEADKKQIQYELLATAIPALSYAAAANPLDRFNLQQGGNGNFNMMKLKNGGWPAERGGEWHHSDFRDVAMSYTWPMFQEMIKQGGLDEE